MLIVGNTKRHFVKLNFKAEIGNNIFYIAAICVSIVSKKSEGERIRHVSA